MASSLPENLPSMSFDPNTKFIDDLYSSKKGIHIEEKQNLMLFRYNKKECNLKDDLVRKCRGLIIDKNTKKIVCSPPEKSLEISDFMKSCYNVSHENIVVEEFIDGTMINVFYYDNNWMLSTRSCIGADCKWSSKKSFKQMFDEAKGNLNFENVNKNWCFTFVLRHKENRIVKDYKESDIVLVNVKEINNNKVVQINLDKAQQIFRDNNINIKIPNKFKFNSWKEIYTNCHNLPYDNQGYIIKYFDDQMSKNIKSSTGLIYDCEIRTKIRNENYTNVKFLRGNNNNIHYNFLRLRQCSKLKEYLKYFPEHTELFNDFTQELYFVTTEIYKYYLDFRVNKIIKYEDIPIEYRKHVYVLHGIYLNSRLRITFGFVINFVNKMDIPLLLHTINFQKKKNNLIVEGKQIQ